MSRLSVGLGETLVGSKFDTKISPVQATVDAEDEYYNMNNQKYINSPQQQENSKSGQNKSSGGNSPKKQERCDTHKTKSTSFTDPSEELKFGDDDVTPVSAKEEDFDDEIEQLIKEGRPSF